MGEKNRPIQYDELALNLYKNTMTGEWKKVVETYEQHKLSAIDARINKSGDTAFHVAVSIAPEEKVQQLVRVITGVSELGLWTKNNKGNTPLHVAASTGRLNICILLAKAPQDLDIEDLVIKDLFRNNVGESPLFLAAFHGYKPIFLYLHLLLLKASDTDIKSIDPAYRRNDGETALHCAIRWEYFGEHFFTSPSYYLSIILYFFFNSFLYMNKSCCNFFPLSNFTYNSHVIYFLFDKLQVQLMFFIYLFKRSKTNVDCC